MKHRNIPFGYHYENGMPAIQPAEAGTVKQIFDSYIQGQSLLNIAKKLNDEKAEYIPGVYGWNKARLMRIIDDSRYLGNDLYPAIIPAETYEQAHLLKDQKNTQKEIDRTAGIFRLAVPVICPNCGNEMHRRHDSRWKVPQRWGCHNSECKTIIKLSDTDLLQSITNILNRIISQPDIIEMSIDTNEVGNDIRRLNMEIAHALETCSFNKEDLRKKMLTCVSLKYKGIDSATYTANRLKADFEKSSPLSAFSAELCRRTVKSIQLKKDGTVGLTLINDQQIGKEKAS